LYAAQSLVAHVHDVLAALAAALRPDTAHTCVVLSLYLNGGYRTMAVPLTEPLVAVTVYGPPNTLPAVKIPFLLMLLHH